MFERKSSSFIRLAKQFKQRGQVSILFSLLMPIFLLFLGVGLDLGWYYINVSRLQNAADAAAVAGAQTLIQSNDSGVSTFLDEYKESGAPLLVNKYPGKVSNEYSSIYEQTSVEDRKLGANDVAKEYAGKNLSGNADSLVNSWTKNEVEFKDTMLYEQDDNLYFVVQLKDTVRHFFLSGWFDDMDAPVTAVAMLSKNATVNTNNNTGDVSEVPDPPSTPDLPDTSLFPNMPTLPDNPLVISDTFKEEMETAKNTNVIVGNWEVQNYYKNGRDSARYEAIYNGNKVYSERWNHFQDLANHYVTGNLYRTGTVAVFNDVKDDNEDGIADHWGKENGGKNSDVVATAASSNTDLHTNGKGKPYLETVLDSINIDFRPEVTLSGDWLKQDWDISEGFDGVTPTAYKTGWNNSEKETKGRLRIHSSINFDGVYKAREEKDRQDENKNSDYDILWTRIESEPMLSEIDLISDKAKDMYKGKGIKTQTALNSVNQIIINANESNAGKDENGKNYRPVVIFYDGPETNDVYSSYKSRTDVLHRKSLPVILNLNVPFNAILYAPNSPVVIIGDAKDNFSGFVVAKKYMRLKDENDFVFGGYTNVETLSLYSVRTYYATEDELHEKPCYKITDENGIEMFVDQYGDIQFADVASPPTRYGVYNTFGRTELTDSAAGNIFGVKQSSDANMFLSGN